MEVANQIIGRHCQIPVLVTDPDCDSMGEIKGSIIFTYVKEVGLGAMTQTSEEGIQHVMEEVRSILTVCKNLNPVRYADIDVYPLELDFNLLVADRVN